MQKNQKKIQMVKTTKKQSLGWLTPKNSTHTTLSQKTYQTFLIVTWRKVIGLD